MLVGKKIKRKYEVVKDVTMDGLAKRVEEYRSNASDVRVLYIDKIVDDERLQGMFGPKVVKIIKYCALLEVIYITDVEVRTDREVVGA